MNFDFSDEQKQMRDEARKFLADKCPPRAVRVVLSRPRAIPEAMMLMSGTNAALKAVAAALGRIARARA